MDIDNEQQNLSQEYQEANSLLDFFLISIVSFISFSLSHVFFFNYFINILIFFSSSAICLSKGTSLILAIRNENTICDLTFSYDIIVDLDVLPPSSYGDFSTFWWYIIGGIGVCILIAVAIGVWYWE